MIILLKGFRF